MVDADTQTQRHLTTKGLFLRALSNGRYALEDVFGTATLPFHAGDIENARTKATELAAVRVLCEESELGSVASSSTFRWFELENYYIAKLSDHFRYWQVGSRDVRQFDLLSTFLPVAYHSAGFGEGSKDAFEEVERFIASQISAGRAPFTSQLVSVKLAHIQLGRTCADLMSLLHRAITSFHRLLSTQRLIILEEAWSADHLDVAEIVHSGPKSYDAATHVTVCVISLCTSLDLSSKLIHFLNGCSPPLSRFKSAQGKQFAELAHMRPSALPSSLVSKLVSFRPDGVNSLVQLRHDLVHSTAALEMEKVYVGRETDEINSLPLHYCHMPWRDSLENGQPIRHLGRDYFTSNGEDIEQILAAWISCVVGYHIAVGEALYDFMVSSTVDSVGLGLMRSPSASSDPSGS